MAPETYGQASPKARAEYDAASKELDAITVACRYCKAARKRAHATIIEGARCKRHHEEARLLYVTSPVSETYWAS